ncbi:MAG: hypothetical protein H0W86_07285 [Armatimonadetes bacterium]|nr:hypothetical protein [Armatimonadota bacterium]
MQPRNLANEIPAESVAALMSSVEKHYKTVQRYYKLKKRLLGLSTLYDYDRYAPLFPDLPQCDWETARKTVTESYEAFSPKSGEIVREFFDKRWIDASPRTGKRGGAFSHSAVPGVHPYILMSYEDRLKDVMTLAHELGHGVHASYSRDQSLFNFHGTLPLAELASTFGEMLVFENLVKEASTKDKLALYAEKIEGVFATVFRQAAMFRFEQACHAHRREKGELSPAEFGELWQTNLQAMFGGSVELGEQHSRWWSYVGHFIFAPFYVYAYSFGELLVLSLYQMAKREGPSFAGKYVDLLKLGGSKTPRELMALMDIDLQSRSFWQGGFAAMENLVTEFERLHAEHKG